TGPTGATGPTGPQGSLASDFVMFYRANTGTAAGTSVANGANVVFDQTANTSGGSKISLNTGTGVVTIADKGFYLVTFGLSPDNTNATYAFELRINNTAGGAGQQSPAYYVNEWIEAGATVYVNNLTVLVPVTTNPTTLVVTNISGAARSLNNARLAATGANTGMEAYITIVKLQ
ncbi:MAG TPA: hypothetical protein VLI69_01200, partial [Gammaproteobacteria bacterium]|nr:hypothetical protein [Gammaproteobacteria bacterium]